MAKIQLMDLMEQVDGLSEDDMLALNSYIITKVKARRRQEALKKAATMRRGDRVRIVSAKPQYLKGLTGEIIEMSEGRPIVKLDRGPTRKFFDGIVRFRSAGSVEVI